MRVRTCIHNIVRPLDQCANQCPCSSAPAAADNSVYVGCYRVERPVRVFSVSPGGYDPNNLNPAVCLVRCDQLQFTYSGLTASMFCFCANQLPATKDEDESCSDSCSDPSSTAACGGFDHLSVYKVVTTRKIRGLTVRPITSDTLEVFQQRLFRIDVENSTDSNIQFRCVTLVSSGSNRRLPASQFDLCAIMC